MRTALIILAIMASSVFAQTLRLKDEAKIDDASVRVYDLFEVDGTVENAALFPRPDSAKSYRLTELLSHLDRALPGVAYTATGRSVRVVPSDFTINDTFLEDIILNAYEPASRESESFRERYGEAGTRNEHGHNIAGYEVRFLYDVPNVTLNHKNYRFKVIFSEPGKAGIQSVRIEIRDRNGKRVDWFETIVDIYKSQRVVVAREYIKKNTALTADMFEYKTFRAERIPADSITDLSAINDTMTKYYLKAGHILRKHHVKDQVIVRHGDVLTVRLRRGALAIDVSARAMNAATEGEQVRLRNVGTGREFYGVVRNGVVVYSH